MVSIELEFEVEFDVQPEERRTHDYPGSPAQIEVSDLNIITPLKSDKDSFRTAVMKAAGQNYDRHPVSPSLFDAIMSMYEDDIEQACWEEVE